jgi:putative ABC transport system permease protein
MEARMNALWLVTVNILEEGLIYGILAMGVYISYHVLSFPDLTVDGSFPLGGCVSAVLLLAGVDPVVALLAAFACGCFAGLATGLLNVRLGITDLLSGILVMTALWSVNLAVAGGKVVLPFFQQPTVFSSGLAALLPAALRARRVLIVLSALAIITKFILDWYFSTQSGLLLRATGDNAQFVSALNVNPGSMKILGLALGNGLAAVSGSALAQQAGSANAASGTGRVVMGLASVIIGLNLFKRLRFLKGTTWSSSAQ